MSDPNPAGWASRFLRGCIFILAGTLALDLAIDIIRNNWAWIAATIIVTAVLTGVIWWLRHQSSTW